MFLVAFLFGEESYEFPNLDGTSWRVRNLYYAYFSEDKIVADGVNTDLPRLMNYTSMFRFGSDKTGIVGSADLKDKRVYQTFGWKVIDRSNDPKKNQWHLVLDLEYVNIYGNTMHRFEDAQISIIDEDNLAIVYQDQDHLVPEPLFVELFTRVK